MTRLISLALAVVCSLIIGSSLGSTASAKAGTVPVKITVYVTATGKCYHLKKCKTIKRSKTKHPITLEDAIAKGYKRCKVCLPPK